MISTTKRSGCIPAIAFLMCIVIAGVMAFQPNRTATGNNSQLRLGVYTVTHTQSEWQAELDTLRAFQNIVGYQMSRETSEQWQLVAQRMQQRLIIQLQPQIMAELKKDSTKNK